MQPLDFIGNAPTGFSDQSDAIHPAGFPIITISIRYWFAIDIAIRYRSCPAFSIASSDPDPERTMTPVAAWLRYAITHRKGLHGWANVWGRTLGFAPTLPRTYGRILYSPIMLDSRLCPKVAALPRYVIRIPPINPESDKSLVVFSRARENGLLPDRGRDGF